MSLAPVKLRVPLGVQVGVVAALFVAALVVLWTTGALVVARERRRSEAKGLLDRAGDELAARGSGIIAREREFPDYPEEPSRAELDRELSAEATAALARHAGIEGGYLVLRYKSFLGTAALKGKPNDKAVEKAKKQSEPLTQGQGESRLPPLEADLIDIQVDAAIRKKQVLFSVEELEGERPVTVAIRTAPLVVDGRVVGASWVITRLVDPLFVDRSLQGYRWATGLALGGIVLSFALTAGLARTVRRQAVERDRLQTDLRRSERLAALGKLLAGVAHEVRNPLAGIRSTAQLWQRGFEVDADSLGGLVDEVDRLEEIVSSLLQFSRADAQDLAPGDLNAVLAEAARLAAGPAELKGVRVEVELDPDLPPVAMAPPALLQVFRNLTTNAIHAMSTGGTLRLTTRRHPSRQAALAIVADTGPGLTPEVIGHLFEPFFTTKSEGTGLGLAIAREIALAHSGDLGAANRTEGPGAVFTLTLPATQPGSNGEPR
ncbi:Signal transduction histidine kinase [Singulisphaera sp. GP187]|uniref:sensor histidine kinase n=1 Tax=Singulisphaera sp. GP187 TaxID=1882752 RepID=UPI00092A068C|nr:ATP-binding protein [Singulisphaera sp. GP187]SIN98135.1 Signal transduction histidine kinase [Singulisphaera sp. GP187]